MEFDDVMIVPRLGNLRSRSDVNLKDSRLNDLYPIISSPMKGISGPLLVNHMAANNCLGILHRFDTVEKRKENIEQVCCFSHNWGVAIGIKDPTQELEMAKYAVSKGTLVVCVDVANGYLPQLHGFIQELKKITGNKTKIMAGNVATAEGAKYLMNAGVDMIRVGIGSGMLCRTRSTTGCGVPQLLAIRDCSEAIKNNGNGVTIIADGGIRNSADIVKCLSSGADYVMIGSLFGKCIEAENDGQISGMASRDIQLSIGSGVKSIEGVTIKINNEEKRPLKDVIEEMLWNIRSACTYLNSCNHLELRNNAEFISTGKAKIL